jgi:hypothetical protein
VGDALKVPLAIDLRPFVHEEDAGFSAETSGSNRSGDRLSSGVQERDAAGSSTAEYELTAVVVHTGRLDQGHYYCLARLPSPVSNPRSGAASPVQSCYKGDMPEKTGGSSKWVKLDDHRVSELTEAEVLALAEGTASERDPGISSNAYMLFYTRKR